MSFFFFFSLVLLPSRSSPSRFAVIGWGSRAVCRLEEILLANLLLQSALASRPTESRAGYLSVHPILTGALDDLLMESPARWMGSHLTSSVTIGMPCRRNVAKGRHGSSPAYSGRMVISARGGSSPRRPDRACGLKGRVGYHRMGGAIILPAVLEAPMGL